MSDIPKPHIAGDRDPIDKIAESVLKRKFPELFDEKSQGVFEIELSPNRNLRVTEPSVYDYESNGKIILVCESSTKGKPGFERSQITTDRDGVITGMEENSYLADFPPDVIEQLRKIGREYYSKMQPLIRERNRVVARILEVMFETT